MSKNLFTGEAKGDANSSPYGLIDQALLDAINKAKDGLQTSYLEYEIVSTTGEYGGFVQVHNMYVTIRANAAKSEEQSS